MMTETRNHADQVHPCSDVVVPAHDEKRRCVGADPLLTELVASSLWSVDDRGSSVEKTTTADDGLEALEAQTGIADSTIHTLASISADPREAGDSVGTTPADRMGLATTSVAIREARVLCGQALRHLESDDLIEAAARLELINGVLNPAMGWLLHSCGLLAPSVEEQESPETSKDDMPGFYL